MATRSTLLSAVLNCDVKLADPTLDTLRGRCFPISLTIVGCRCGYGRDKVVPLSHFRLPRVCVSSPAASQSASK